VGSNPAGPCRCHWDSGQPGDWLD